MIITRLPRPVVATGLIPIDDGYALTGVTDATASALVVGHGRRRDFYAIANRSGTPVADLGVTRYATRTDTYVPAPEVLGHALIVGENQHGAFNFRSGGPFFGAASTLERGPGGDYFLSPRARWDTESRTGKTLIKGGTGHTLVKATATDDWWVLRQGWPIETKAKDWVTADLYHLTRTGRPVFVIRWKEVCTDFAVAPDGRSAYVAAVDDCGQRSLVKFELDLAAGVAREACRFNIPARFVARSRDGATVAAAGKTGRTVRGVVDTVWTLDAE